MQSLLSSKDYFGHVWSGSKWTCNFKLVFIPASYFTVVLKSLQANIEEKFEALQKKEEEMQELRKNVRERDRLLENMTAIMMQHEDAVKVFWDTLLFWLQDL